MVDDQRSSDNGQLEGSESDVDLVMLEQAAAGDQASWSKLLVHFSKRLFKMVALRLDPRLAGRIDIDDVLQEIFVEAWRSLPTYLNNPQAPFYLWLRGVASNKLLELHRRHLGVQMRDARREVSLRGSPGLETTSDALANELVGNLTPPSEVAMRSELKRRLQQALDQMDPIDREVLALRHFEQLTPVETAGVLGIEPKAAGMRYVRALRRLKSILGSLSGESSDA